MNALLKQRFNSHYGHSQSIQGMYKGFTVVNSRADFALRSQVRIYFPHRHVNLVFFGLNGHTHITTVELSLPSLLSELAALWGLLLSGNKNRLPIELTRALFRNK